MSKNTLSVLLAGLVLGFGLTFLGMDYLNKKNDVEIISPESAKEISSKFIDEFVANGTSFKLEENGLEGDYYRFSLEIAGKTYPFYLSNDGKYYSNNIYSIEEVRSELSKKQEAPKNQPWKQQVAQIEKREVPFVEAFVMSYCPYGTQIEKGLLPVMDLLKDKAQIEIKFVDYAMHGEKELDENTRQYCVQKEQNDKFKAYLGCFLESGDTKKCLSTAKIDENKLNRCVAETDQKFQTKVKMKDKSTWANSKFPVFDVHHEESEKYQVAGSPTLVINGQKINAPSRDSASLLEMICTTFSSSPEECQAELSSEVPSPGFGNAGNSNADGSCS